MGLIKWWKNLQDIHPKPEKERLKISVKARDFIDNLTSTDTSTLGMIKWMTTKIFELEDKSEKKESGEKE